MWCNTMKYKGKTASGLRMFLKQWDLQIMVAPAIICIIIFAYIPMWGILFAFKDYDIFHGFFASKWVGFKHFIMLFEAPEFPTVMRNTLVISCTKFIFGFPAPILLALMLNDIRFRFYKRTIQTLTYLPYFLSWVVVSGLVFNMLQSDGWVNDILVHTGLISKPAPFLMKAGNFLPILVTSGIWKNAGYGAIIYLAAISTIDPNLYEAADIDGASRFQKTFYITLPSISHVIVILMILAAGQILNAGFDDIYLLTNNMQNFMFTDVANSLDIYVYKSGVLSGRFSYGTAAGLFKGVVTCTLLTATNYIARKLGRPALW